MPIDIPGLSPLTPPGDMAGAGPAVLPLSAPVPTTTAPATLEDLATRVEALEARLTALEEQSMPLP